MQHAGLQYGQGAVNSHQSPPFAHADISHNNGGTTTSSLRQFRKKDGSEKNSTTDLNTNVENSHIARVPPHNHYPARPNEYFRYQHQYADYNSPYKETPAQVKYSEIAETPPQTLQHVDHIQLQKHKEVHKDFMDMCNITQQTHMKQNYTENLPRQQNYPPDAGTVHHQYLHKEPQVHSGYKPESQYQQYPQLPKYNMPSQCRKYAPPPPENDFLAKLQRINPSMARSIMSDHHIRESQTTYPTVDQNRMYQNQRYYPPTHLQNNISYNYQPYNYPSSCNYKHPDYGRNNQMGVGTAQYPSLNPHTDRSLSPRNLHMMNYGTSTQKISPNYSQYNPPEYAQHYQHRRTSLPQDYYQQNCRTNPYMTGHQISPEPTDNRGASGGLRHFIENWAEEDPTAEITPIFKENIRLHNTETNSEQVLFINSSDIPQCLENVSLVPTENGQFIIKTGALDNSVVRIKETENEGEKTVNLQIVEKSDCLLNDNNKTIQDQAVPYQETQNQKDCDDTNKIKQTDEIQQEKMQNENEENLAKKDEVINETSVIVTNEVSVIKDMPIIEEEHGKIDDDLNDEKLKESENHDENFGDFLGENHIASTTRRTQRIFSVDDIINNIGSSPSESRRNSLQFIPKSNEETSDDSLIEEKEETNGVEYRNAISVEDDDVILEIGGAWVQLHINHINGTKILSVVPLSDSLIIDANGNYQSNEENLDEISKGEEIHSKTNEETNKEIEEYHPKIAKEISEETNKQVEEIHAKASEEISEETSKDVEENHSKTTENISDETNKQVEEIFPKTNEEISDKTNKIEIDSKSENLTQTENLEIEGQSEENLGDIYQNEIIIGEESIDNEVFVDLSLQAPQKSSPIAAENVEEEEKIKLQDLEIKKRKSRDNEDRKKTTNKKLKSEDKKDEERLKLKKSRDEKILKRSKSESNDDIKKKEQTKKHDDEFKKNEDYIKIKKDKKLSPQNNSEDDEAKKRIVQEEILKFKRLERRSLSHISTDEDENKKEEMNDTKMKKQEKKIILSIKTQKEQNDEAKPKEGNDDNKLIKKEKKLTVSIITAETEESTKSGKNKKLSPIIINTTKGETRQKEEDYENSIIKEKKISQDSKQPNEKKIEDKEENENKLIETSEEIKVPEPVRCESEKIESKTETAKSEVVSTNLIDVAESPTNSTDVVQLAEEMITLKQLEETKEAEKLPTKAAKKLYTDNPIIPAKEPKNFESLKHKKSISKLEETVNKIKSMKEKVLKEEKTKKNDEKKSPKTLKKVTFNLETEIREINKEEIDKKKLSLEEYNSRKRRSSLLCESEEVKNKIMEDVVTSTGEINDDVVEENSSSTVRDIPPKKSPPKLTHSSWEDDTPPPESPIKEQVQSTTNRKCIIDVNEFNIKPIETVSTPSPVSSSQFSYHSEDDSLQVYKDVVDSKLNSLNIKIPKLTKPKPIDRITVLLDRFLNKGSLTYEELEEVKKFIEIKRKMLAEEKKLTYEVRGERDYNDLKLHFKKVPEKRKKKRFRNLYAEESSDESDSSRSEKNVGDYSVYQRDSQGVPKLIFKRKSGLPQPFVKLERSQAVELLAKKRKLY